MAAKTGRGKLNRAKYPTGVACVQHSVTEEDLRGVARVQTLVRVAHEAGIDVDDLWDVEDVHELRATVTRCIQEKYGSAGLGQWLLSVEPLRDGRRKLPVPGVDFVRATAFWDQARLNRAVLSAVQLAATLGRDPLAARAPLRLEVEFVVKLTELVEGFLEALRAEGIRNTACVLFHEFARIYEGVAECWPRKNAPPATAEKLTSQYDVMVRADQAIDLTLLHWAKHLEEGAVEVHRKSLTMDGPTIRKMGGPRDAASFSVGLLLGPSERTIQSYLNDVSPIGVARTQYRVGDDPQFALRWLQDYVERNHPTPAVAAVGAPTLGTWLCSTDGLTCVVGRRQQVVGCNAEMGFHYEMFRERDIPNGALCGVASSACEKTCLGAMEESEHLAMQLRVVT